METIKVGDYIRTSSGKIAKYLGHEANKYKFDDYIYWYYEYYNDYVYDEDFEEWLDEEEVKVYKNIIDLIEVGDYVNGKKVIDTYNDYLFDYSEAFRVIRFSETDILHNASQIKSIVTKEQFESIEYRIGE